jgi:hypothetical protein
MTAAPRASVPRHASAIARTAACLLALATGGCEAVSLDDAECPAWTRLAGDRCVLRAWILPTPHDALGEPGARDVQVALGSGGDALVAWSWTASTGEGPVVLAEPVGEGWSLTETQAGEGSGLEPAVAVSPEGRALLAWKQQRTHGAIHVATRDPDGTWQQSPASLSWSETAYEPRVAFAPDGEAFVLWNQWTGAHFGVAMAVRPADRPEDPFMAPAGAEELLSPPINYANAPRLALGERGDALVAWYQAPEDDLMVYVSERRGPGGAFTRPDAQGFVSPTGGPVDSHAQQNPWPALHPSGAAAVAWTQQRAEGDLPVYLATRDPDGTWHRPASLDDPLSHPGAYARCPQLAFAPDGTLVITWFETRGDDTAVLTWAGRTRDDPTPLLRLSTPGRDAVQPTLAIGPDSGAIVAWAEGEGDTWQVVARRHQPDTHAWLPAEPLSDPFVGLAPAPQLALAPDGGRVLAAWAQGGVLDGRVLVAVLP